MQIFSLFGQSGAMEQIPQVPALPKYCKVYCYGYGMSATVGAVIAGPNEHGQYDVVIISDYEPGFTTVDQYSRPHSKKFGIGNYYDDNLQTEDAAIVEAAIKKAKAADRQRAKEEDAQKAADAAEVAALPGLYPYLTINKGGDQKISKSNLVAMLKKQFPGVKFSVRKRSYDAYNVDWTNGPTIDEVKHITCRFEDHATDVTGDYRDYEPSNFNRVFGGFKYIFEHREKSAEIEAFRDRLAASLLSTVGDSAKEDPYLAGQILNKIFHKASFPADAVITGIERRAVDFASIEDLYEITYLSQTEQAEQLPGPESPKEPNQKFEIIDYSEKAIALIGDTRKIKEDLKTLGGRFNPRLSCGPGWIFSKTKQDQLQEFLTKYEPIYL